ncbi:MAG: 50S ribosomal protein L17 [Planctomycetes bacterium]|nr:50S ribosomal protein L17 [Planctomycetota bacterium]
MRHLKRGRKLNRNSSHRKAMLRNLVASLFEHGKVVTSPAKAKEARPLAEKLVTIAKRGTLADRRRAIAILDNKTVVRHLFSEIAPRYAKRNGGFCRILHLDKYRIGDGGALCLFELVEEEIKQKGAPKRTKARVEPKAARKAEMPEAEEKAPKKAAPKKKKPAAEKKAAAKKSTSKKKKTEK